VKQSEMGAYLTEAEVAQLLEAARRGQNGVRDYCLMLLAYRHGLEAAALAELRIEDVDIKEQKVHFPWRATHSVSSAPLLADECGAIQSYLAVRQEGRSSFLFVGDQGPMSPSTLAGIMGEIAERAGLKSTLKPGMLRISHAYHLLNGVTDARLLQRFFSHLNPKLTLTYMAPPSTRFTKP
jgi:type 1 fimbriae regulatory protein FimE